MHHYLSLHIEKEEDLENLHRSLLPGRGKTYSRVDSRGIPKPSWWVDDDEDDDTLDDMADTVREMREGGAR